MRLDSGLKSIAHYNNQLLLILEQIINFIERESHGTCMRLNNICLNKAVIANDKKSYRKQ